MDLFELMNNHLIDKVKYQSVKQRDKKRHSFMINRIQSIRYIDTAVALSAPGINECNVVDFWNAFYVSNKATRPPGFWRTPTKSSKKAVKIAPVLKDKELISKFINMNRMGTSDWEYMLLNDRDGVIDKLKKLDKHLKDRD